MESIWAGGLDNSFFSPELFDKYRKLYTAEEKSLLPRKKSMLDNSFYILGVDVGRVGCSTEVCVIKVVPGKKDQLQKHLVNIYTFEEEDFEIQSCKIKEIAEKFDVDIVVVDGNGLIKRLVHVKFFELLGSLFK